MADEQQIIRDMTDGATSETRASGPYIVVPGHAVNYIECDLYERMQNEILEIGLPPIFVDQETGELEVRTGITEPWRKFFDGRLPAPWECAEIFAELSALVEARYAPRIIIARELGPDATQAMYVAACTKEGIEL